MEEMRFTPSRPPLLPDDGSSQIVSDIVQFLRQDCTGPVESP